MLITDRVTLGDIRVNDAGYRAAVDTASALLAGAPVSLPARALMSRELVDFARCNGLSEFEPSFADRGDRIEFFGTAPDGRRFGIGITSEAGRA